MLNQFICCGRLIDKGEYCEEHHIATIYLKVPRNFKNEEGIYEDDLIPVNLSDNIYSNIKEYCQEGDLLGVKGRIQEIDSNLYVFAEKITFLSSNNKDKE